MSTRALKLFISTGCPYCHRAEIVAHEKKLAVQCVQISLKAMPDWYKQLNPSETVPTLQVDDSKLVFESNLIAQYLDNVSAPAGSLMGSTPYQRHRIEFFQSQIGDMISAYYKLLRNPLSSEARKNLDDNAAYIDGLLAENQSTGPFYCDKEFTMADVALIPFLVRFRPALMYYAGYDIFSQAPHLKALWAAGKERPSVQAGMESDAEYVQFYSSFAPATAPMAGANGGYVLYGNKLCPFVDRARLACAVKKLSPFWVEIDLANPPEWYKYVNFRETVPAMMTPEGTPVHESQLIVQYVDNAISGGRKLMPTGDPEKEYEVTYFTTIVGYFTDAMYGIIADATSEDAKAEFVWAAGKVDQLLKESTFGSGPFHGGSVMNAGDIALLPMLVRTRSYTPELTNGYDVFAEFPRLAKLLEAGMATEEAKGIFADLSVYTERAKARKKN